MKIATWNVNSIAVRTPQALDWIEANRPDALCLQETKCVDAKFPFDAFREIGYTAEVFGQPTYNGVAILSLRSEEHTSELQSRPHLVCRLLLEKKKKNYKKLHTIKKKTKSKKKT